MTEKEIIRNYEERLNIAFLFKCNKQYLKFGKDFQSPTFKAQNAQIALAFTRYMIIAIEHCESEDYRSCGELFMLFYQEMQDTTFIQSFSLILELFKEGMKKQLGVSEEQIQTTIDYFLARLPGYIKRGLSATNGMAQYTA